MTTLGRYERHARLAPGLLALVPVSITLLTLGIADAPAYSTIGGLLVAAGGPILLSNSVRGRGRLLQERLYGSWGGAPTTQLLRLRGEVVNSVQSSRWREHLGRLGGVEPPNLDGERADWDRADEIYQVLTSVAREVTRADELVQAENRSYGFHRNLLAMRPVGLGLSLVSALVISISALLDATEIGHGLGLGATILLIAMWAWWPTEERVRDAAFRYAYQLFNSATTWSGADATPTQG